MCVLSSEESKSKNGFLILNHSGLEVYAGGVPNTHGCILSDNTLKYRILSFNYRLLSTNGKILDLRFVGEG